MHLLLAAGDAPLQLLHPLRYWGYEFWSGLGSDFSELTLIIGVAAWATHHNCHRKRCWRLGHAHPDHGRPTCARHYHDAPELQGGDQ